MIKRYFTLMEALIAIALFSVVIAGFWSYIRVFSKMQSHVARSIEMIDNEHFMKARIGHLIRRSLPYSNSSKAAFYTRLGQYSDDLVFVCDQGVDYQPQFSNETIALLYINTSKQLCLTTWPYSINPSPDTYRTEILMDAVSSMRFIFTDPSEEEEFFTTIWDQDKGTIPLSVRIQIEVEDRKDLLELVYLLPNNDYPLILNEVK